jgi:hypothetical protein
VVQRVEKLPELAPIGKYCLRKVVAVAPFPNTPCPHSMRPQSKRGCHIRPAFVLSVWTISKARQIATLKAAGKTGVPGAVELSSFGRRDGGGTFEATTRAYGLQSTSQNATSVTEFESRYARIYRFARTRNAHQRNRYIWRQECFTSSLPVWPFVLLRSSFVSGHSSSAVYGKTRLAGAHASRVPDDRRAPLAPAEDAQSPGRCFA